MLAGNPRALSICACRRGYSAGQDSRMARHLLRSRESTCAQTNKGVAIIRRCTRISGAHVCIAREPPGTEQLSTSDTSSRESRVDVCAHSSPHIPDPCSVTDTSHDATGRFDNINNSQHTHQPSLSDPTITISRARRVLGSAPQTVPTFRWALGPGLGRALHGFHTVTVTVITGLGL